jgi:hypothetical protein
MGVPGFCRLAAVIVLQMVMMIAASQAQPADDTPISPYVISGLVIDVSAENAVKAREKAFQDALYKSYAIMIERLVPVEKRSTLRTPDAAELGRLLNDFTTKNEQMGATRYTATYEMRFKPRAVSDLLASGGPQPQTAAATIQALKQPAPVTTTPAVPGASVPVSAALQKNVLILPFYQPGAHPVLWSGNNPLREALQRANLQNTTIKVPLGDLEDVQAFDETRALTYTPGELSTLLKRYDATDAIIAIAVPDGASDATHLTGLSVLLYRAGMDLPTPRYLQAMSVTSDGLPGPAAVYGRAIDKMRAMMPVLLNDGSGPDGTATAAAPPTLVGLNATDPISTKPAAAQVPQSLQLRAKFRDLQEWQQMRSRLGAIPTIQNVRVMSLKTNEARLEVVYSGAETGLIDALQSRGLQASAETSDIVEAAANTTEPSTGIPVVYALTFNPWLATGGQVIRP